MNKDNAKDYLPLVQALADGKVIQFCGEFGDGWVDLHESAEVFNYGPDFYRIKPEPKEIWTNRYKDGSEFGLYESREEASRAQSRNAVQVRYREVIE